jgi:hypothetical protein
MLGALIRCRMVLENLAKNPSVRRELLEAIESLMLSLSKKLANA